MPTNQKNFLTRFLLGSVASTVAQVSPCPTLIVKQKLVAAANSDVEGEPQSAENQ